MLSIYSISSDELMQLNWKNVIGYSTGYFLLERDLNGHHQRWGSTFSDRKWDSSLEMVGENLIVINDFHHKIIAQPNHQKTCVD